MKVRVRSEFKDKHTGELHPAGEELDLPMERVNEILRVGSFVELVVSKTEPEESRFYALHPAGVEQEETENAVEQTKETPKQTGRRKSK